MAIKLIVGLGNPGSSYEKTRHNAGFWFIDDISLSPLSLNSKFKGKFGEALIGHQKVFLLKPETYMNKSGESVVAVAHFYKILPEEILIVHDELDLLPGTIRLKKGGGLGGHNGLKSIAELLGTKDFNRLRVGIGHPGHSKLVADFVLTKAPESEMRLIDDSLRKGREHLISIVNGEFENAMNQLHRD